MFTRSIANDEKRNFQLGIEQLEDRVLLTTLQLGPDVLDTWRHESLVSDEYVLGQTSPLVYAGDGPLSNFASNTQYLQISGSNWTKESAYATRISDGMYVPVDAIFNTGINKDRGILEFDLSAYDSAALNKVSLQFFGASGKECNSPDELLSHLGSDNPCSTTPSSIRLVTYAADLESTAADYNRSATKVTTFKTSPLGSLNQSGKPDYAFNITRLIKAQLNAGVSKIGFRLEAASSATNEAFSYAQLEIDSTPSVAKAIEWNEVEGNEIKLTYTNRTNLQTVPYELYWAKGSKTLSSAIGFTNVLEKIKKGSHTDFIDASRLTTPPRNANRLVFAIIDSDEQNSKKAVMSSTAVRYDTTVTVKSSLDANTKANTFGRFYSDVPIDRDFLTIQLHASAALLTDNVVVNIGGAFYQAGRGKSNHRLYNVFNFEPSKLRASTRVKVKLMHKDRVLVQDNSKIVEVVALPKWIKDNFETKFVYKAGNPRASRYEFKASIFNNDALVQTDFRDWLVGGKDTYFQSGLDATIHSYLSPAKKPVVFGVATAKLRSLDRALYSRKKIVRSGSTNAGFTFDFDLVPKTLAIRSASFGFKDDGARIFKNINGNRKFSKSFYQITSRINANLSYSVDTKSVLRPNGLLNASQSYLELKSKAALTGNLQLRTKFVWWGDVMDWADKLNATSGSGELLSKALRREIVDAYFDGTLDNVPQYDLSSKLANPSSINIDNRYKLSGKPGIVNESLQRRKGRVNVTTKTNPFLQYLGNTYSLANLGVIDPVLKIRRSL